MDLDEEDMRRMEVTHWTWNEIWHYTRCHSHVWNKITRMIWTNQKKAMQKTFSFLSPRAWIFTGASFFISQFSIYFFTHRFIPRLLNLQDGTLIWRRMNSYTLALGPKCMWRRNLLTSQLDKLDKLVYCPFALSFDKKKYLDNNFTWYESWFAIL